MASVVIVIQFLTPLISRLSVRFPIVSAPSAPSASRRVPFRSPVAPRKTVTRVETRKTRSGAHELNRLTETICFSQPRGGFARPWSPIFHSEIAPILSSVSQRPRTDNVVERWRIAFILPVRISSLAGHLTFLYCSRISHGEFPS